MTASDHDLLSQFTREQSQEAFADLVRRHLNLVYTAALRQVRSPQLAEEVSQSVFTQLARHAAKLNPGTILTAWLYQVTRHAAIDVVRREARRQAREQIACQMSDINETSPDWTHIELLLDEAMDSLEDADRTAILLRYFENKSLREVGEVLSTSDDAAQKRVSRAIDRLREFFTKRKVAAGAGGLAALVSAHAVQAAPAGLAAAVVADAFLASNVILSSTAVAVTKNIAMTTIQKTFIAAVVVGTIAGGLYQTSRVSKLRHEVQTSRQQQQEEQAVLSNQVQELEQERDRATNALAGVLAENAALKKNPSEVLKLRGEVGRLRQENTQISSSSALSKVTASPEARKMLRDQQKLAMDAIYKSLAQQLKLAPEQAGQLGDMLADHIMDNVDNVTTILRDKLTAEQMNGIFEAQDAALREKLAALLGQDGLAAYQDYTQNLLINLSTEQFWSNLSGNEAEKAEKSKQLRQALQEETQAALTSAGLPMDYQTVPMLNFANIASEQHGDRSLKLMEDIYTRTAARGKAFLNQEELAKFEAYRTAAVNTSRSALMVNRTMMQPISK